MTATPATASADQVDRLFRVIEQIRVDERRQAATRILCDDRLADVDIDDMDLQLALADREWFAWVERLRLAITDVTTRGDFTRLAAMSNDPPPM